ncbi:peptidyl-alpha-hydroxyglycine alpha-amidating lyase family protein [Gammaproteobacteria bacterium]|nr:peptidyl-alpha-hydroxyglycine alpha-amidating lyase family protein [Gammaproteobacteria bacterium]
MKYLLQALLIFFISVPCFAQRPDRPFVPLNAYSLEGYTAIEVNEAFNLPRGIEFASVSSLEITSKGHLIVLHRAPIPFLEFDAAGNFIRAFGSESLFSRAHGLTLDDDDNMWVTDVINHVVMKLDTDANLLMTMGTRGEAGEWNEANGSHKFYEPADVAFDSLGNIYVGQGHTRGVPKILKFNAAGEFITQWGGFGTGPGEFAVAHSIEIDTNDNIYVADRENFRVQIFDVDGLYLSEWNFNAMACALYLHDDGFMYMTTGFDGEIAKVDLEGNVIGSLGRPGLENGQFGEGHFLALDKSHNIFIADVVNRRVQLYRKD